MTYSCGDCKHKEVEEVVFPCSECGRISFGDIDYYRKESKYDLTKRESKILKIVNEALSYDDDDSDYKNVLFEISFLFDLDEHSNLEYMEDEQ